MNMCASFSQLYKRPNGLAPIMTLLLAIIASYNTLSTRYGLSISHPQPPVYVICFVVKRSRHATLLLLQYFTPPRGIS